MSSFIRQLTRPSLLRDEDKLVWSRDCRLSPVLLLKLLATLCKLQSLILSPSLSENVECYAFFGSEFGWRDGLYSGTASPRTEYPTRQGNPRFDFFNFAHCQRWYFLPIVLQEVIRAMCGTKFVDELFKPQLMYTNTAVRSLFEHVAHSSIMRLNESSMDRVCSSHYREINRFSPLLAL